jgi:competence protein ComFA
MSELWGRKLLQTEFTETLSTAVLSYPAFCKINATQVRCFRCGSIFETTRTTLPNGSYYCSTCIHMGRVVSGQQFFHLPEPKPQSRPVQFQWQGQLTAGQQKISQKLKVAVEKHENLLIWAVTGAGKTEMLFEALHYSLKKGSRVAIASPRVDVCLELYPRIQTVFPKETIALLHGKAEADYRYTKLVICTVHQLLRFYQAFDLLIVDEVDSFPFVNNENLYYAVENALKKISSLIYLTATPTKELKAKINQNILPVSILPARYHRRALPVPKLLWYSHWQQLNSPQKLKKVRKLTEKLLQNNKVLIFCPSIAMIKKLGTMLMPCFPNHTIEMVYGADEGRLEKVMAMREHKIDIFITSTILERGVTFDQVSVIVYGANHRVFSASALVQIAGRVDRRNTCTNGEVWFLHNGQTKEIREAIRQIKEMNCLAEKEGYIDAM